MDEIKRNDYKDLGIQRPDFDVPNSEVLLPNENVVSGEVKESLGSITEEGSIEGDAVSKIDQHLEKVLAGETVDEGSVVLSDEQKIKVINKLIAEPREHASELMDDVLNFNK
jgi:prephenate dehydratase